VISPSSSGVWGSTFKLQPGRGTGIALAATRTRKMSGNEQRHRSAASGMAKPQQRHDLAPENRLGTIAYKALLSLQETQASASPFMKLPASEHPCGASETPEHFHQTLLIAYTSACIRRNKLCSRALRRCLLSRHHVRRQQFYSQSMRLHTKLWRLVPKATSFLKMTASWARKEGKKRFVWQLSAGAALNSKDVCPSQKRRGSCQTCTEQ